MEYLEKSKKSYKTCVVSQCKNTSYNTDKLFIYVTRNVRQKWLLMARRDPHSYSKSFRIYICEDHFDLPNDMLNYKEYEKNGTVSKVKIKYGHGPSKFECLTKICHSSIPLQKKVDKSPQKTLTIAECLNRLKACKNSKVTSKSSLGLQSRSGGLVPQSKGISNNEFQSQHSIPSPSDAISKIPKDPPPPITTFESIMEQLLIENDNEKHATKSNSEPSLKIESQVSNDLTLNNSDPDEVNLEAIHDEDRMITKVCIICFATNCNLYIMTKNNNLGKSYEVLTGLSVENDSDMPPYLCVECSHRLLKCNSFRTRSLRAHLILLEVLKKNEYITLESINTSIGNSSLIGSSLAIAHKGIDHYDLDIVCEEKGVESITEPAVLIDSHIKSSDYHSKDVSCHSSNKDNPITNDKLHTLQDIHTFLNKINAKSDLGPTSISVTILDEDIADDQIKKETDENINQEIERAYKELKSNNVPLHINFDEYTTRKKNMVKDDFDNQDSGNLNPVISNKDVIIVENSNTHAYVKEIMRDSDCTNQDRVYRLQKRTHSKNCSRQPNETKIKRNKTRTKGSCNRRKETFKCNEVTEEHLEQFNKALKSALEPK